MSLKTFNDKSTLVQVMPWCHQARSHHLNQWWACLPTYICLCQKMSEFQMQCHTMYSLTGGNVIKNVLFVSAFNPGFLINSFSFNVIKNVIKLCNMAQQRMLHFIKTELDSGHNGVSNFLEKDRHQKFNLVVNWFKLLYTPFKMWLWNDKSLLWFLTGLCRLEFPMYGMFCWLIAVCLADCTRLNLGSCYCIWNYIGIFQIMLI